MALKTRTRCGPTKEKGGPGPFAGGNRKAVGGFNGPTTASLEPLLLPKQAPWTNSPASNGSPGKTGIGKRGRVKKEGKKKLIETRTGKTPGDPKEKDSVLGPQPLGWEPGEKFLPRPTGLFLATRNCPGIPNLPFRAGPVGGTRNPVGPEGFQGKGGNNSRRWFQKPPSHTSHLARRYPSRWLQTGHRISLALDEGKEILIGRLDAMHSIFPELDLTNDAGLEHGVSRRHARIYARNGVCYLEDMDSTNGTFLGDERLTPYLPYELHDGDIITLGTMRLRLRLHRRHA